MEFHRVTHSGVTIPQPCPILNKEVQIMVDYTVLDSLQQRLIQIRWRLFFIAKDDLRWLLFYIPEMEVSFDINEDSNDG